MLLILLLIATSVTARRPFRPEEDNKENEKLQGISFRRKCPSVGNVSEYKPFLILVADPLAVPIQTVEKVIDASKEYFGVKVEPSEKDNEQEVSFGAFSYYDEDEEGSFSSEVRNFC